MELILVIQNSVQQDYRPEMYPSYQNISSFNVVSLHRPGIASHLTPPPLLLNLYENLGDEGNSYPTAKNLLIFPNKKTP